MWNKLLIALACLTASVAGAKAQASLEGNACVGTMVVTDGSTGAGSKGAAAFVFENQSGTLVVHHFFGIGAQHHDRMVQAVATSARPAYDWLTDGGYASNVQVADHAVSFEKRGIDPRSGHPVIFRSYVMSYGGGRMTGHSTPKNDVMENGHPGRPTQFSMTCFTTGTRQASN